MSSAAWVVAAALVQMTSGFAVPGMGYAPGDAMIAFILFTCGLALAWALGGAEGGLALRTYSIFVVVCNVALVLATMVAFQYGTDEPVWLVSRYVPRDDSVVFLEHVLPFVTEGSVSLGDATTNAPLFWLANIRLQQLAIAWTGGTQPIDGLSLNIVLGGVVAAVVVVTAATAGSQAVSGRSLKRTLVLISVTCPWLIASSIIFIRDIWVYAVFSALLLAVVRLRGEVGASRIVWLTVATAAACAATALLRLEMVPIAAALGLVGFVGHRWPLPRWRRGAVIGIGVLVASVAAVAMLPEALERAQIYRDWGREEAEHGTLVGFLGESLLLRTVVQTAWAPINPLPRVLISPGAVYHLAKTLMPLWTIAVVLTVRRECRRSRSGIGCMSIATDHGRYTALLLWVVATVLAVGATSGETRHTYVVVPAVVALAGAALRRCEEGQGPNSWMRSVGVALAFGAACLVMNLVVFGPDGIWTYQ